MTYSVLGSWLAVFLNGYVVKVVGVLSAALAPLALALLTIYIANYGFAVLRGEVSEPLSVFGWKVVKTTFITTFALGAGLYMDVIANAINGLQDGMATVFISSGYAGAAPGTVWGALDNAFNQASATLDEVWKEAGFSRLDLFFVGIVVTLGMDVFLVVGAVVAVLSKAFMAFALAIGPAAILCLLFKPSAKFFDAWLSTALAAVVMSWFVFFALGLALFINDEVVKTVVATGAFTSAAGATVSPVKAALMCVAIYVILGVLVWQAPSLASALTGGAATRTGAMGAATTAISYMAGRSGAGGGGSGASGGGSGGNGGGNSVRPGAGAAYSAGHAGGRAYQQVARMFSGRG
jgi:type IV secretion system protein VirB6